ncbi:MAG: M42 family metallopeptidase [Chthonomonadales bacterium]
MASTNPAHMLDPLQLLAELIALPGPPGQEDEVRLAVERHVKEIGKDCTVDAKGNLLVPMHADLDATSARIVVTAHLDEIALMVTHVEADGLLRVKPLGGLHPWKWGDRPVSVLAHPQPLPGVLGFGSIHTEDPASVAQQARTGPLKWHHASVFTGLDASTLRDRGVRPGTRVVLAPEHRILHRVGPFVAAHFLDDRADIVAWLLAIARLGEKGLSAPVLFAATTAEEVGGEGASYLLGGIRPHVCVALEIGPSVPEGPFAPHPAPTIWVADSFSAASSQDLHLVAQICRELGIEPRWQALSRGGSDASCAAHRGLCARPITLGIPVENSHGLEIMHQDAPAEMARLLAALVERLAATLL